MVYMLYSKLLAIEINFKKRIKNSKFEFEKEDSAWVVH